TGPELRPRIRPASRLRASRRRRRRTRRRLLRAARVTAWSRGKLPSRRWRRKREREKLPPARRVHPGDFRCLQNPANAEREVAMPYLTNEDVTNFGPELVDLAQRAAQHAVGPELQELERRNAELSARLAREVKRNLDVALERAVPDWRQVNQDPRWLQW